MSIGEKLRKRRYDLGKTQEWVAFELGSAMKIKVSQPTINNWENNKSHPSLFQLQALATTLGTSVSYFISETETETETEKWRKLAEENAERCRMLEKMNVMLLKEIEQLRRR